ncbi:MAG: 16S rRNA (cytidine(1402)-2'-O)-methyltransferase [Candidatus Falkowbacteria bacterium]
MLYIVSTPIGNLEDITLRALRTLKEVDYILCEDTRVAGKLLAHYEIKSKLISFHQHSSPEKVKYLIDLLRLGNSLALITDAGTPGISDPGGKLIEEILKLDADAKIVSIPGASAITALVAVSGMPIDRFAFYGFLPNKNGRQKMLKEIALAQYPVILYESKHRILKMLREIILIMPSAYLVVGRELTKMHETIYRGSAESILQTLEATAVEQKGEFVVIIKNEK